MFEFKVTLDDEDYLEFNTYHALQSRTGKRALFLSFFVAPAAGVLIASLEYLTGPDLEFLLINSILIAIIGILWLLFHRKIMVWLIRHQLKKLKQDGRLPYIKDSILRFTEESIEEISPAMESKTDYSLLEKLGVTDQAVYVYISAAQAILVPAGSFRDEEEKQSFIRFIQAKIRS